jgi:hypothetical protein
MIEFLLSVLGWYENGVIVYLFAISIIYLILVLT